MLFGSLFSLFFLFLFSLLFSLLFLHTTRATRFTTKRAPSCGLGCTTWAWTFTSTRTRSRLAWASPGPRLPTSRSTTRSLPSRWLAARPRYVTAEQQSKEKKRRKGECVRAWGGGCRRLNGAHNRTHGPALALAHVRVLVFLCSLSSLRRSLSAGL